MKKQKMRREDNISPDNLVTRTKIFETIPKLDKDVFILSIIAFIFCVIIIILTQKNYISIINTDMSAFAVITILVFSSLEIISGIVLVIARIIERIIHK